jgi:ubiquinone/menaquinone biosynthesis C-methylase UbiE
VIWLLQTFLRRYARGEARDLAPHIRGERLLDLGAGEGWVGAAVRALTSAWTCAADIGPFRRSNEPYVIYDGQRLPFGGGTFDTTLISLVLHHCETPEPVLAEAVRVTRTRLLVVESVYRSRLERFWLELLDGRLNRHRHGGQMPVPLAFKPPEQWRALFESHGLTVVAMEWLGSWVERRFHHPLLFVLDKSPGRARSPPSGQHGE